MIERVGWQLPRVSSPEPKGAGTRVDEFLAWIELHDFERLMPWQVHVATEMLRVRDDGKWLHRTAGLMVGRQNGKSHLMRLRVLWGMFELDESWIGVAQRLPLMEEHLEWAAWQVEERPALMDRIANPRQGHAIRRTNGKFSMQLKPRNGKRPRWDAVAGTVGGPRGLTGNLWVDELREITEPAYNAATPVATAVPNAQILISSNAGSLSSTVLNRFREAATTQTEPKIGWWEWSADPLLSPKDPVAWEQATPALGHRIGWETLEDAYGTETPEAWLTERLCRQVDAFDSPWPYGAWDKCLDENLRLSKNLPSFLALDVTPDRRHADLVVAQQLPDGRTAVAILHSWDSETTVDDVKIAADVSKYAREWQAQKVGYSKWNGANIAQRLMQAGFPMADVSGQFFAQACDETLAAMTSERLVHFGQSELTAHVSSCVRSPAADGGWRVKRDKGGSYISAACAMITAIHFASKPVIEADIVFV